MSLKVLSTMSSEMDLSESGIYQSVLKVEGRRFLEKFVRPPSFESPLKIMRHLVQLLATRILIPNSARSSVGGLYYYINLLAMALRTNMEPAANGAVNFLGLLFYQ
jgi:hypothetical protein